MKKINYGLLNGTKNDPVKKKTSMKKKKIQ